MTSLTITLSNDRMTRLQEIAARLRVTPEELARLSIEELLATPESEKRGVVSVRKSRYILPNAGHINCL